MKDALIFVSDWSLKSVAIVVMALAIVVLLNRRSASAKHLVWRTALLAIALMPLGIGLLARAPAPAVMEPIQAPIRGALAPLEQPRPHQPIRNPKVAELFNSSDSAPVEFSFALAIYGLGVFGLLFRWLTGHRAIRSLVSFPYGEQPPGKARILMSADARLRVPVTFGWFRPVILLPQTADSWPQERIDAAILHEAAHIQRRDWAWQTGASWICAAQWFNPAMWLLSAALGSTAERAADDDVLASGLSPATYAGELLNVAEAAQGRLFPATAMARPGGVATRLRRIMEKGIDRRKPGRKLAAGVGVVFFVCGLAFAVGSIAQAAVLVKSSERGTRPTVAEAKLKTGAVVRLAFVSQKEDPAAPSWRPDGGLAATPDIASFETLTGLEGLHSNGVGHRTVVFNYLISNLNCEPDVTDSVIYRVKGHSDARYDGGVGTYRREQSAAFNRDRWVVPASLKAVDIECAIASVPYQTFKHGRIGEAQLSATVGKLVRGQQTEIDGKGKPFLATLYNDNASTVHMVLPRELDDQDVRLLAWDAQGQQLQTSYGPMRGDPDKATGGRLWDFTFGNSPPSDVVTIELQTRKFERVTFKNVRLYPNSAPEVP